MIKIAVCDDDKEDREKIYELIRQFGQKHSEAFDLRCFESGEQFLGSKCNPDILFLDIIMYEKDGIQTGFEIKKHCPDTMIIYITNISEKISTAVNHVHSYGYLVKPVSKEELFRILADALRQAANRKREHRVTFLSENNTIVELPVKDIIYFEYIGIGRKIKVVAKEKTCLCVSEKIGGIADRMKEYGFAMSHQSFVVNLYQVELIDGQMLLMKNGDKVYLAQKRASTVKKQLMQLAKEALDERQWM